MHPQRTFRITLVLLSLLISLVPLHADKRRAVQHPSTSVKVDVSGTVIDNVTGQPVIAAKVHVGGQSDLTDSQGKYLISNVQTAETTLTAERSGYGPKTAALSGGTQVIDFRLDPLPTTTVRLTNGTTIQVDTDSIKFGYTLPFAGYVSAESEEFCKPDGTKVIVDRSQMKRIIGPAVSVASAPCCSASNVLKVKLELKSGETSDVFFVDSCDGYSSDLIARNHVTGKYVYLGFEEMSEVIFP